MSADKYEHSNFKKRELVRAFSFALYFFTIIAAYYFLKPLSRSLYITYVGSSNLPYVWIATTLVLSILIPLYQWKLSKLHPLKQILTLISSLAILLTFFRFQLDAAGTYSAFGFYILIDVYSVLLVENFWSLINSVYRDGSGKRWYGLIASGGMLGALFGSAATSRLIETFGLSTLDLIIAAILIFIIALLLVTVLFKARLIQSAEWKHDNKGFNFKEIFNQLTGSRYLRLLAGLLLAAQLIEPIVEFQFMSLVESEISSLEDRTKYVSEVFAYVSIFGLLVNLVILPLVHTYIGLAAGLLLQPLLIGLFSFIFLFWQALFSVSMLKIVDRGLSYSSGRASRELLYIRYDTQMIYNLKAWIDIYGYRLFRILGSLLILLITNVFSKSVSVIIFSFLSLLIITAWARIVKIIKKG